MNHRTARWASGFVLSAALTQAVAGCPADPGAPGDALVSLVVDAEAPVRITAGALALLAERRLTQRRTVSSAAASTAAAVEQSITYTGVLLRDLIAGAPGFAQRGRAQRFMVFEAVAADDYRAVFSWGELFNGEGGDQALVVRTQDGQPLNDAQGPLALRALGDFRPGPRHVRNLCAIVVHTLGPASR